MKGRSEVVLLAALGMFLLVNPCVWAATITEVSCSVENTWFSTATGLANNTQVDAGTINQGVCAGYRHAWCTLNVPSGFNQITATNGTVIVWARVATDVAGTIFPDGGAAITPRDFPLMTFILREGVAIGGAQIATAHIATLPLGVFKATIRNDNTGGTMNGTWSVKCRPYTESVN